MNYKTKILALVLILSALLIAANSSILTAKAQTNDSVYIYNSLGGTIATSGTTLPGGSSYPFANGTAVNLDANASEGYKLLCWEEVTSAGGCTSTSATLTLVPATSSSAVQALFIPTGNSTTTSPSTGTSAVTVLSSAGGETNPKPDTYNNYTIGSTNTFTATPGSGFKFLYWIVIPASGQGNVYDTSTLSLNITANSCGIQAMFIPTDSDVTLSSIVPEYSSVGIFILAAVLVAVAMGTFIVSKRNKK